MKIRWPWRRKIDAVSPRIPNRMQGVASRLVMPATYARRVDEAISYANDIEALARILPGGDASRLQAWLDETFRPGRDRARATLIAVELSKLGCTVDQMIENGVRHAIQWNEQFGYTSRSLIAESAYNWYRYSSSSPLMKYRIAEGRTTVIGPDRL